MGVAAIGREAEGCPDESLSLAAASRITELRLARYLGEERDVSPSSADGSTPDIGTDPEVIEFILAALGRLVTGGFEGALPNSKEAVRSS